MVTTLIKGSQSKLDGPPNAQMSFQAPDSKQGHCQIFDPLPRGLQNGCQLIDFMGLIFISGIKPFERKGLGRLPRGVGSPGVGKFHDRLQKTDNPIRGKRGLAFENEGGENTASCHLRVTNTAVFKIADDFLAIFSFE